MMGTELSPWDSAVGALIAENGSPELAEKWQRAVTVLREAEPLARIWNRSRSDWALERLVCCHPGPVKNIRQVSAEIEAKRAAITEAKFALMRLEVDVAESEYLSQSEPNPYANQRLRLAAAEKREQIPAILRRFEGALSELAALERILQREIVRYGGLPSPEMVERDELREHLARALAQSIRSIRAHGRIDPGNAEYLEQCGCNPSKIEAELGAFVAAERQQTAWADLSREFAWKLACEIAGVPND